MTIIGIDPGANRMGWAILKGNSQSIKSIDFGCWENKETDQGERLWQLSKNLNSLIKKYKPDYLAVEEVFFFKNAKTAMKTSEVKGVVLLSSRKNNVKSIVLTPLEIKSKVVGYGRADKKEVQKAVTSFFNLKEIPQPDDAADALAVALAGIIKISKTS